MNQDGILVSRGHLLKKCLGNCAGGVHAVERCEVVVCGGKPSACGVLSGVGVALSWS